MITTKNLQPFDGDMDDKKARAAYLVQSLQGCPLEFTLEALAVFDRWNSPAAQSPNAKRWIKQFCGFESEASGKAMSPIIVVTENDAPVTSSEKLKELLKDMRGAA